MTAPRGIARGPLALSRRRDVRPGGRPLGRLAFLPLLLARDTMRDVGGGLVRRDHRIRPQALDEAVGWLCRTHDVTGRNGSSKGFSLLRGWLPAYPETTGYVLGTLVAYARLRANRPDVIERARQMGEWERQIQEPDGGIAQGVVGTRPPRSIVFNTGMVLNGWLDLHEAGFGAFEEAAARAALFLTEHLRADGTWEPVVEYSGLPHTYNSRVAWAMLRWARAVGDDGVEAAARRHLDWVISRQHSNGWFEDCIFKPGTTPSTHGLGYTLEGLLESHALAGDERWLGAVERASEALIRKLEVSTRLIAAYEDDWIPAVRYACLTGAAQLGGVWLRLHRVTGDPRWLNAGLKAVEQAAAHQERVPSPAIHGALPGSFPLWGRYAPLQYPNWATKFLADALMRYDECLSECSR
jgi:hypothetical protein